jgi:hypothetical protein
MTILQVLALNYLVAVYPLFLIAITHIAAELHSRLSMAERMWSPLYTLLVRVRREWHMRSTIMQAFATFMILSYAKILSTSFDLLRPVHLRTPDGGTLKQTYLYINGEIVFFGDKHLPYAILAIMMLTVFNILPMAILFLLPCQRVRRPLDKYRFFRNFLIPLVNIFQGSYRHKTRYFGGFYLLVRMGFLVTLLLIDSTFTSIWIFGFYFLTLTTITTLSSPYKEKAQNMIAATTFLLSAATAFLFGLYVHLRRAEPQIPVRPLFLIFAFPLGLCFILYGIAMLTKHVVPRRVVLVIKRCCRYMWSPRKTANSNDTDWEFLQELEQEHS